MPASSSATAPDERSAISILRMNPARSKKVEICALCHIPSSRFVYEKN